MTITQNNWLDLKNLLINEIFGSVFLFLLVGSAFIAYYGYKEGLPYKVTLAILLTFWGLVLSAYYISLLWALILVLFALVFYIIYTKTWKR